MTNKEKFEETFGFKPTTWIKPCELLTSQEQVNICRNYLICADCPFNRDWWDKEYLPCFKMREVENVKNGFNGVHRKES